MVLFKHWKCFHLLFILGKLSLKPFFTILYKEKKTFLDYKHKKLKKSKNWKFSKGFSPWFCQKLLIFPFLYFKRNRSRKCVSRYSRNKKRWAKTIKRRSLKIRKIGIFLSGLVRYFGQKLAIFFVFLFNAKKARKMCLTLCLREKKTLF